MFIVRRNELLTMDDRRLDVPKEGQMRDVKSSAKQSDWPWKGGGLALPAKPERRTGGQSDVEPPTPQAVVRQPTCGVVESARPLWEGWRRLSPRDT